jgi:hypothetical protein
MGIKEKWQEWIKKSPDNAEHSYITRHDKLASIKSKHIFKTRDEEEMESEPDLEEETVDYAEMALEHATTIRDLMRYLGAPLIQHDVSIRQQVLDWIEKDKELRECSLPD